MIVLEPALTLTPALLKTERLAGRFSNFVPVLGGRVDVLARRLIRRQFETEGRAGGRGSWKGLTRRYQAVRQFPGRPILRQTDDLYNALTKRGDPNQEVVLETDQYSLSVSEAAGKIRARFVGHQRGVPVRNVPVRQAIPDPLPESFIKDVRRAIKAYIIQGST